MLVNNQKRESIISKYRYQWIGLIVSLSVAIAGAILRAQTQIETGLVMFIGGSLLTITIFLSTLIIKGRDDIGEVLGRTFDRIESEFRGNVEQIRDGFLKMNEVSQRIATDPNVRNFYDGTIDALCEAFEIKDDVFRELAISVLNEFRLRLSELSRGTVSFRAESFRFIYQKILSQEDVRSYKSIAWLKSENYWADEAGKFSVDFNYNLLAKGKSLERIFILRDKVWMNKRVKKWIHEQRSRGVDVKIVKESSIPPEEDLLYDLGIYGDRAVGYLQQDDNCRTLRFDLHFDKIQIDKAMDIFERLKTHALRPSEVETYLDSIISSKSDKRALHMED